MIDGLVVERVFLFVFHMWMEKKLTLVVPLMLLTLEQRGVVARIGLVVVGVVEPIQGCSISGGRHCNVSGWRRCRIVRRVPWGTLCK